MNVTAAEADQGSNATAKAGGDKGGGKGKKVWAAVSASDCLVPKKAPLRKKKKKIGKDLDTHLLSSLPAAPTRCPCYPCPCCPCRYRCCCCRCTLPRAAAAEPPPADWANATAVEILDITADIAADAGLGVTAVTVVTQTVAAVAATMSSSTGIAAAGGGGAEPGGAEGFSFLQDVATIGLLRAAGSQRALVADLSASLQPTLGVLPPLARWWGGSDEKVQHYSVDAAIEEEDGGDRRRRLGELQGGIAQRSGLKSQVRNLYKNPSRCCGFLT